MIKIIFAVVAGLLAIIGNVPYLRDTIKRRIQPHPYTWLVWSIVSGITLFAQITEGAGWGSIPFIVSEFFTFTIFIFSLRYGFKDIPKTDKYFLIAALLGIIPWILTNDPAISVIIMVSIDLVAFIPTLKKGWYFPRTEAPLLYSTNAIRHSFALVAISSYNISTTLHSIAMIVVNTTMSVVIFMRKNK